MDSGGFKFPLQLHAAFEHGLVFLNRLPHFPRVFYFTSLILFYFSGYNFYNKIYCNIIYSFDSLFIDVCVRKFQQANRAFPHSFYLGL